MIKLVNPRDEELEICRAAAERRKEIKTTPATVDSHTYILVREKPEGALKPEELRLEAEIFRNKWKENQLYEEKHPRLIYLKNERLLNENI